MSTQEDAVRYMSIVRTAAKLAIATNEKDQMPKEFDKLTNELEQALNDYVKGARSKHSLSID